MSELAIAQAKYEDNLAKLGDDYPNTGTTLIPEDTRDTTPAPPAEVKQICFTEPLTVKELIEVLAQFPQDAIVIDEKYDYVVGARKTSDSGELRVELFSEDFDSDNTDDDEDFEDFDDENEEDVPFP